MGGILEAEAEHIDDDSDVFRLAQLLQAEHCMRQRRELKLMSLFQVCCLSVPSSVVGLRTSVSFQAFQW